MTTKTVYLYTGEGGTIQTTIKLPIAASSTLVRLIADSGKELVKGDYRTSCIDATEDDVPNWQEVEVANNV